MLKPLEQFICDTCGEIIEKPIDGWFEWLGENQNNRTFHHSFRICHHSRKCQSHSKKQGYILDTNLTSVIREKGIIQMLNFLDIGSFFTSEENYKGPNVRNFREYTEIFRRLSIPYYEEARLYIQEGMYNGDLDGYNEIALYSSDTLKRLIEKYSEYNKD